MRRERFYLINDFVYHDRCRENREVVLNKLYSHPIYIKYI